MEDILVGTAGPCIPGGPCGPVEATCPCGHAGPGGPCIPVLLSLISFLSIIKLTCLQNSTELTKKPSKDPVRQFSTIF